MSLVRSVRVVAGLAILGLAGCVAPPPVAVVQGQAYVSNQCYAGAYLCTVAAGGAPGTPCACPGLGAPSYGQIR